MGRNPNEFLFLSFAQAITSHGRSLSVPYYGSVFIDVRMRRRVVVCLICVLNQLYTMLNQAKY